MIFLEGHFRNQVDSIVQSDNIEDSIHGLLNEIEDRATEIREQLEPIEGLAEVNEIKEKVEKLCEDLY
jgi:methyl coenzyme M reductase gamma subunit